MVTQVTFWKTLPLTTICCVLCQCSQTHPANAAGFNGVDGPFDSRGNYIEDWADDSPSKVRKKTSSKKKAPTIKKTPPKTYKKPSSYSAPPKPRPKKSTPKPTPKPKIEKAPPKPTFTSHKVIKGNTLYGLSRQYGVSVPQIQKANQLSGNRIQIGQVLKIPRK